MYVYCSKHKHAGQSPAAEPRSALRILAAQGRYATQRIPPPGLERYDPERIGRPGHGLPAERNLRCRDAQAAAGAKKNNCRKKSLRPPHISPLARPSVA